MTPPWGAAPRQRPARRGFSLSYGGKTLLSVIDPIAQAERIVENLVSREKTLYFVPSPLYGYGLEALCRRMSADSAVLCVEADPQLHGISREAFAAFSEPRLILAESADTESLCALLRRVWGSRRFHRVETLRLSGGWQLAAGHYAALAAALEAEIAGDWGNALTLVRLGRRYALNFIRNLALIPRARSVTAQTTGNEPVLVLGAGPSLDGILDALSARFPRLSQPQDRHFRIIAVDTALRCLLARNIAPDLVVALECQHWNLGDFIGTGTEALPVAMDLSALPATAEYAGGSPRIFFTPWTPLRLFKRLSAAALLPAECPPLGSVGLTTAALALRLGSGPVITGGLDFSFTLEKYHARGTPGSDEKLRRATRLTALINGKTAFRPGNAAAVSKEGRPVFSGGALKKYRDLFEREFSNETRLRDIRGPGLNLGIPVLELDEALRLLEAGGAGSHVGAVPAPDAACHTDAACRETLAALMARERGMLVELRDILSGAVSAGAERLSALLDDCGYLWAHFPECAGGGRRPAPEDGDPWVSFLKRVRVELDPFIRQWDRALREAG